MCRPPSLGATDLKHATDSPKHVPPTTEENIRSAFICVSGMGAFVATDALGKVLVTVLGMPVLQMLALRGLGMVIVHSTIALSAIAANGLSRVSFTSRDSLLLSARVVLEALASWFFNLALMHLPMAMATAVVQALPLVVMLGAAVLGEPIGRTGWLLALVAFTGVLVIVRPTAEGIDLWSLCALIAVVCMATRDLITRSLGSRVPSSLAALAGSIGLTMFSAGGSWLQSEEWQPLDWPEWSCLAGAALTASIALLSSISLMRLGSVAFVQPFRYTLLLWASLMGWMVFSEVPDGPTIVGSILLVGAGYCNVQQEHARGKAAQGPSSDDAADQKQASDAKAHLGSATAMV